MPEIDIDLGEKTWFEYRRLVLHELERSNRGIEALHTKLDRQDGDHDQEINKLRTEMNESIYKIRERISFIEGKAAVLGVLGGLVISIIVAGVQYLLTRGG